MSTELLKQVGRIWDRLRFVVGRGRVALVDDSGNVQYVQVVLSPLEAANLRRVAEFGLASNPPAGSDAVAIFVGGDRSNGVVIGTNNQSLRPKGLQPGEVMVYDAIGQSVYLSKTGIVVNGGGNPINIGNASQVNINNVPQVNINGATTVTVQASSDIALNTPAVNASTDINAGGNANVTGIVSAAGYSCGGGGW